MAIIELTDIICNDICKMYMQDQFDKEECKCVAASFIARCEDRWTSDGIYA